LNYLRRDKVLESLLKNIEKFFKNFLNKLVQNRYEPQLISDTENIFNKPEILRILLLRHDRIGDVLISSHFLKRMRELKPKAEIDILLSFRNYNAKRAVESYIDDILILQNKPVSILKLINTIRRKKYDLIIDLFDNESATSNLILKYSKAKYKLGFDKSNSNNYTHIVPLPDKSENHITQRLQSLFLPFGEMFEDEKIKLEYSLKDEEVSKANELLGTKDRLRLGINLSGSSRAKYWGNENYIGFINEMTERYDIEIVLFTTQKNLSDAEYISSESKSRIAPIQSDFNVYAAMLAQCDCIISPDTAAVHLASAHQIPIIALFQLADDRYGMPWYPIGNRSKSIVTKDSISSIQVKEVVSAFEDLIKVVL